MFKRIMDYMINKRDIWYILSITILSLFLIVKCSSTSHINDEVGRLNNNIHALTDTLKVYRDNNNRIIGEKHSLQIRQDELNDSIKKLLGKNRELVSYINTIVEIRDTVVLPTYIERDNTNEDDRIKDTGTITLDRHNVYGKSHSSLHVSVPFTYIDSLITYPAKIDLSQKIHIEGMMERDKKTGQTYIRLISDFPYVDFDSADGIMVVDSSYYDRMTRKTKGVSVTFGPSIGLSYDLINKSVIPTIGLNVTFGVSYTPRFLQW